MPHFYILLSCQILDSVFYILVNVLRTAFVLYVLRSVVFGLDNYDYNWITDQSQTTFLCFLSLGLMVDSIVLE